MIDCPLTSGQDSCPTQELQWSHEYLVRSYHFRTEHSSVTLHVTHVKATFLRASRSVCPLLRSDLIRPRRRCAPTWPLSVPGTRCAVCLHLRAFVPAPCAPAAVSPEFTAWGSLLVGSLLTYHLFSEAFPDFHILKIVNYPLPLITSPLSFLFCLLHSTCTV